MGRDKRITLYIARIIYFVYETFESLFLPLGSKILLTDKMVKYIIYTTF